jgi:hypothetical protein
MTEAIDDTPLRLACALVHGVAGAALSVDDGRGKSWLVAHDPRAAVNPCSLRAALLGRIPGGLPPSDVPAAQLRFVSGLDEMGGGLFRSTVGGRPPERWLATTLGAAPAREVLSEVADSDPDGRRFAGVQANVHPDPALGVTVVRLSAGHPSAEALLDQVGIRVLGRWLVGELLDSVRHPTAGR